MHTMRFWNILHRTPHSHIFKKTNNLDNFWGTGKNTKWPKQDSQNWLKFSSMREIELSFDNIYIA